jgi:signal transduction histidine kinase
VYAAVFTSVRSALGEFSPIPSLLTTFLLAVAFSPIRDGVQNVIDRVFYKKRLQFRRQLQKLSALLTTTFEYQNLKRFLEKEVPQELQLTGAWLVQPLLADPAVEENSLKQQGASQVLPLKIGDEVIGMYGLGNRKSGLEFNSHEKDFIETLGNHAATALANARAFEAKEVEYQERERLVATIHDTAKNSLAVTTLELHAIKPWIQQQSEEITDPLLKIEESVDLATAELGVAMAILNTRPSKLPLPDALAEMAHQFARVGHLKDDVQIQGTVQELPLAIQETLRLIAREALLNIVNHAEATQVSLILEFETHGVRLTITDNGRGIDPNEKSGFGLQNMERRANEIKGTLQVQSVINEGTRIEVWVHNS